MKDKCLVLLSGGQDSATCLAIVHSQYRQVYTISFKYGQKHQRELLCSKKLSKLAKAYKHIQIPISSLSFIGNSNLFKNSEEEINLSHKLNSSLPSSFIPARNFIFLGIASSIAYKYGIKDIYTGVCQTDYSGYPDCRDNSIKAIQLAISLCLDYQINIYTPLMFLTKAETILKMQEAGKLFWYASTHTCYNNKYPPCLICPSCKLRIKGFEEAKIIDPIYSDRGWQ